ncbi:hypothetical protein [Streptomyces griseus]|uniref:hypothetical protein n=1 Tax=Streptomyces griseus TaxID=1911 RepID=UPI000559C8DC|nr:hypothetical protein [Streptomyces griseus]
MTERDAWLKALARWSTASETDATAACPHCGRGEVRLRYVVDPDSRVGFALMWCDACGHGISVSRVRAPEGAPVRSIDDATATEGVPEFTRVE